VGLLSSQSPNVSFGRSSREAARRGLKAASQLQIPPSGDWAKKNVFFAGKWQQFGMPQVQLPIFPAGVTHINSEVAFKERDGKVYYFNGHLPVFVHEKSALATFRLFSTQLVINGNATQAEISRAFGVPLVTVKRYVKLYRESGAAAFFAPAKKRSASKLTAEAPFWICDMRIGSQLRFAFSGYCS
jgi:hypothetical protein